MLGTVRLNLGDDGGLEDVERSVDLSRSTGSIGHLSRHVNGLSVAYVALGDVRAAGAARRESGLLAQQIGSVAGYRWYQGVLCDQEYHDGNWDEALALCDVFLARIETGERHYMTAQAASVRAQIEVARGDDIGAVADIERALEQVRVIADPQLRHYTTALAAHVLSFADPERAVQIATEFLALLRGDDELQFAVIALPTFAAAAHRLGLAPELGDAVAGRGPRRWFQVLRAYGSGDLVRAADLLHEIGSLPDEAEARVLAGGDQLEAGLAFFRSVGATRFDSPG
jgi:hypothetical protein